MSTEVSTGPDVEAIRGLVQWATDHPEEHNQEVFAVRNRCGSAYCIAGKRVVDLGWSLDWFDVTGLADDDSQAQGAVMVIDPDGFEHRIFKAAQDSLGLTTQQAADLFEQNNTLRDLWRIANTITDGAIEIPEEYR